MDVSSIDFGAEDARNLKLKDESQRRLFLETYVSPRRFRIEDFFDGSKYFVYGQKGAGKTALLQYIRLRAELEIDARTSFYYFQSAFSQDELKAFLKRQNNEHEQVLDDTSLNDADEAALFWRIFLLSEVSKILLRSGFTESSADDFHKLVEACKLISQARNIGKKYPSLQKFSVTLSRNPEFKLEGTFEEATVSDLAAYLDLAENKLEDVYLENCPVYIFIDEMETYSRGDASDELRLSAIASLIRAVRTFNERYQDIDIRIIAAVRDIVVNRVSVVQGEVYRIIRDNGVELDWPYSVNSGFHPLERMVLNRIVAQDQNLRGGSVEITDSILREAVKRYFPGKYTLRNCLNLTWYRPRDIALLFEEAATIDIGLQYFRKDTLENSVLRTLGRRMWQDAISGLAIKYVRRELEGIDRIFRGGNRTYTRDEFIERLNNLSDQFDEVALLSDRKWMEVIEDLYNTGVLYALSADGAMKNFVFRGDPMPTLTGAFRIGVHQSLTKELSLR